MSGVALGRSVPATPNLKPRARPSRRGRPGASGPWAAVLVRWGGATALVLGTGSSCRGILLAFSSPHCTPALALVMARSDLAFSLLTQQTADAVWAPSEAWGHGVHQGALRPRAQAAALQ